MADLSRLSSGLVGYLPALASPLGSPSNLSAQCLRVSYSIGPVATSCIVCFIFLLLQMNIPIAITPAKPAMPYTIIVEVPPAVVELVVDEACAVLTNVHPPWIWFAFAWPSTLMVPAFGCSFVEMWYLTPSEPVKSWSMLFICNVPENALLRPEEYVVTAIFSPL